MIEKIENSNSVLFHPKVHTGRYYETEYTHKDKELLDTYTNNVLSKIDFYRSPSKGDLYFLHGLWHCVITYYGLD